MVKIFVSSLAFFLSLALFGCRSAGPEENANSNAALRPVETPTTASSAPPAPAPSVPIDIASFAGRPSDAIDAALGAPLETSRTGDGGDYRLYKINGQSKGLAVRFYGGRARSFNLIADAPLPTAKEALKRLFALDVGAAVAKKDAKEPLTESFAGTFGGVRFKKLAARRAARDQGFIFVLAEVAE